MTLAIRLDDGTLITDPGWHTVADVMASAHGQGVTRMPGELVRIPERIQRRRTRGWRMPASAVYVGRPTVFGNPAVIEATGATSGWAPWLIYAGDVGPRIGTARTQAQARAVAVDHFRRWLASEHGIVGRGPDMHHETRAYVAQHDALVDRLHELRGRDLACWCPLDQPCHADVLLELANNDDTQENR